MNDLQLPSPACQQALPPRGERGKDFRAGKGFAVEKLCRFCRRYRRGAAVVEFAVVAPVLITLVFGMIEFGRLVMVQQILTNASREGARVGVLTDSTTSQVQSRVVSYLASSSITISSSNVAVSYASDASLPDSGEAVTVTTTIPYSQVSWLPSPMFLKTTNLVGTASMRRETVD